MKPEATEIKNQVDLAFKVLIYMKNLKEYYKNGLGEPRGHIDILKGGFIFNTACENVFKEYGSKFEFKSLSHFKSYVSRIWHAQKKNEDPKKVEHYQAANESVVDEFQLSAGELLDLQISQGLVNPDSYY